MLFNSLFFSPTRAIKDPKNTKLLYDILNFSPADIKQAVLFATNNALVCDTPEDAMRAAYEIDGANRYDVSAFYNILKDFLYHKAKQ